MADLKKICKSELNLKITSFFRENPIAVDTSAGIATWLNLDRRQTEKALNFLVSQKILNFHRTGSTIAYAYTQNKNLVRKIEKFLGRLQNK